MSNNSDIEVDPKVLANDDEDYESAGYNTSTQSLSSSINAFVFENGRRYHVYYGAEKNLLPNDETEQDRLDMHHEMMLLLLGGSLHKAPLNNPQKILDVGTGTGVWAIDMADRYPSAWVTGSDLSPIQPNWVPPNCNFEVDDAEKDWTHAEDTFDYVHARNLAQSITDWPKLTSEMFRCTKPGGYIELAELGCELYSDDGTLAPDNAFKRSYDLVNAEALPRIGRHGARLERMAAFLKMAGCVDITTSTYKQPYGLWPRDPRQKQIGAIAMLAMETGIEAYVMAAATRIMGMEAEEAQKLCAEAWKSCKNKNHHVYTNFYVVYGKKPMD